MKYSGDIGALRFNPKPSTIMHIDLNSCFATIEQQANPHLRGRPVAVAAYTTPSGCIIAPSIEAKRLGIKVGMRVKDGKMIYPNLVVIPPDPWKYRNVHLSLRRLISDYTDNFYPKSIDEFVLNLEGYPCLLKYMYKDVPCTVVAQRRQCRGNGDSTISPMHLVAREIKTRIKKEIGDWLTVSVGIAPNRFLAKTAAGLRKPDGLDEINKDNFTKVYASLELTDLCGIKTQNAVRLNNSGIYTVLDFYNARVDQLKAAFQSVLGYYWYVRLHGWEIDDVEFGRRSYGNSYALPERKIAPEELSPILTKLVTKTGARLRRAGFKARGVHVSLVYRDGTYWHKAATFEEELFDSRDIYRKAFKILIRSPYKKPVRELAVSCFNLISSESSQLDLFDDVIKRESLVKSVDRVNERWGDYVITPARMLSVSGAVPDRIAFGGVKELEEFTLNI